MSIDTKQTNNVLEEKTMNVKKYDDSSEIYRLII